MSSISILSGVPGERLNNRQAAEYLGLKETTLNKWRCHGGGPPYIKLGRLIRYRKADLDAFLMKHVRRSTADYPTG